MSDHGAIAEVHQYVHLGYTPTRRQTAVVKSVRVGQCCRLPDGRARTVKSSIGQLVGGATYELKESARQQALLSPNVLRWCLTYPC